jgi:hypothetical protein
VKNAGHEWIMEQPKTLFSEGIRKLVECYKKCMELHGEYVEK